MELPFPPSPRKSDVFRVGPKPKTLKFGIDYSHSDNGVVLHPSAAFKAAQATPAADPPQAMRRKMLRVRNGNRNRVTSK